MDNHSIQQVKTENKKILCTIQYTNESSINQSQNVNIITYEAVEIPDVITVNTSSCEFFNTVTQEPNVSDVLFEENNDDSNIKVILEPPKQRDSKLFPRFFNAVNQQSDISDVLFLEDNDDSNTMVILEQPKQEDSKQCSKFFNADNHQPDLSEVLFLEDNDDIDSTLVPELPNKKRSKQPKAIPKGERKPLGRKLKIPNQNRAQRKKNFNTNKPYINTKGEEVQPREFDTEFHCTCPKKCTDNKNLPLKTRMQIFNMFWGVGTFEGRCAFISSCVNELPKKRCYTKNKANQKRKYTRKYYLKGNEVCKVTFMKTLKISSSRVDSSLVKSETFIDKRGRKKSSKAFSNEKKQIVVDHIKSSYFPQQTLRGMWNLYMESFPDEPVSESFYKRIFYENFKLKFSKDKIK